MVNSRISEHSMADESNADHLSSHHTAAQPEPQSIIHKGKLAADLPPGNASSQIRSCN